MYFISYDITPNHQRLPWIPFSTLQDHPTIHSQLAFSENVVNPPPFPREFDGHKWGYPATIFLDLPNWICLKKEWKTPLTRETQSTDTNFWGFPSSIPPPLATTSQLQKPFWDPIFVQEDSKFAEILDLLLSIIAGRQLLHRTSSRIRRIVTLVMSAKWCFFVPKLCEWMDAFFGTIHVERSQLTAGIGM